LRLVPDLLGHLKGVQVEGGAGQERLFWQGDKHWDVIVVEGLCLARAVIIGVVRLSGGGGRQGRTVGIDRRPVGTLLQVNEQWWLSMITFGRRISEMTRQGGSDTGKAVDTGCWQGRGGLKASKLESAFMSTGGRS
jgi:hypothetical protein